MQSVISRALFTTLGITVLAGPAMAQLVRSAAGVDAASITPTRDEYRVDLGGGLVAGPNGSFGGLRREINWDGAGDAVSAPNNMPANQFNARGVLFATPGTALQMSADDSNPTSTPTEFDNLNIVAHRHFAAFSLQRMFTAVGSNVVDVNFVLPGTATPALVRGFGSVFSDVNIANTTSIELFDAASASLGVFFAPALGGLETFSFLGISYPDAVISRARITNGNAAIPPAGDQTPGQIDWVVMDDFIYGEPVPEPMTGLLLLTGMLLLRRKR